MVYEKVLQNASAVAPLGGCSACSPTVWKKAVHQPWASESVLCSLGQPCLLEADTDIGDLPSTIEHHDMAATAGNHISH